MAFDELALERLVIDNDAFEALSSALDVFCPFDAIGMSRQEIRHGNFLSYILDPARPHGFGPECLRAFIWTAAAALRERASTVVAPLDVHLMELESANVRREYKSIDLLIEVPNARFIVAVELKIDASEHSGQLGRYRQIVEAEWPNSDGWKHLLLFLTKRGEAPSEEDGKMWHGLGLEPVADALYRIADRESGKPDANMMLKAYVAMLRRDHLNDKRMEDLARGLWREHREALDFLMRYRPDDALTALFSQIYDRRGEIAQALSERTSFTIVPDRSTKSASTFAVQDWDTVPGMMSATYWKDSKRLLLVDIEKDSNGNVRAAFKLRSGDQSARQTIFDQLKEGGADIGGNWVMGPSVRQLAHRSLVSGADVDATDDPFDLVVDGIERFLTTHLQAYDDALKAIARHE